MVNPTVAELKAFRLAAGIPQRVVAELVGVALSTVGNWETGDIRPTPVHLAAYAEAVGWQPPQADQRPVTGNRGVWGWQDDAACQGETLALFFAADGERPSERVVRERAAKTICSWCLVLAECRNYALSRPERYGTWGGLGEEERAGVRRREARRAAPPTPPAPREFTVRDADLYEQSIRLMDLKKLPLAVAAGELGVSERELRSIRRRGRQVQRTEAS